MAAKTVKALGFNRSLVDVVCKGEPAFFYSFQGFGRIRSTQPTGPLKWPHHFSSYPFNPTYNKSTSIYSRPIVS